MPGDPPDYTLSFDGAFFAPLSSDIRRQYAEAWNLYAGLAPLIASIEEVIAKPVKTPEESRVTQYQFVSYDEKQMFLLGLRLHVEAYPDMDWC